MKKYLSLIVLSIILIGCSGGGGGGGNNSARSDDVVDDNGNTDPTPAGGVHNDGGTISDDNTSYNFNLDVFVADESGAAVAGLDATAFVATVGDVVSVSETVTETNEAYSAAVLVDQSGSVKGTDNNDLRVEAVKLFYRLVDSPNNAALYAFAGSGDTKLPAMVVPYSNGFTTSIDESLVDELKDLEGGWSPLFDASHYTLEILTGASNPHKALILLADGGNVEPAGSSYGGYDVTRYAAENDIVIHTVGLANLSEDDAKLLAFLARETGGTYSLLTSPNQLNSAVNALSDLTKGTSVSYAVSIQATNDQGFNVGDVISGNVNVTISTGKVISIPYIVTVE